MDTDKSLGIPVLYCDIDGTIRWGKDELGRFVNTKEDVRVFDEVPELLQQYKQLGWRIIGISNQGGVGLGLLSLTDAMKAMAETQRQCGSAFDKIVFCAHRPDEGCLCRKPRTGLINTAAKHLAQKHREIYPVTLGVFVGDRPEDEECARNAGLKFIPAEVWRTGAHVKEVYAQKG